MKRALALFIFLLAGCATVPPQPVHVVIVGTTDVHGWFNGRTNRDFRYGGVALLSSYIAALRAENPNVILVDSGDMFQGTLESNFFEGEPVVRAYNMLGYAAAAVGNHEFDYGPTGPDSVVRVAGEDPLGAIKKNASLAKFPLLSANMTDKATGRTPSWAMPYVIVQAGGAKIGIIGLSTPDTPNTTVASNVASLNFGDPVAATINAARDVRAKGADAVIVIAHMGGRCTDLNDVHDVASCEQEQEAFHLLNALPAGTIDAYFAGHTHQQMRQFINGIPAVQGAAYSVEFSTVDLWVEPAQHRIDREKTVIRPLTMICPQVYSGTERCEARDAKPGSTLVPRTFLGRTITPDPAIVAALAPFNDRVAAKRNEKIGVTTTAAFSRDYVKESALGDLLTDALRREFKTDFAFMNSGGIRATLRAGDLVYGDVFEVSPFDNYAAIAKLTGAEVREMLRIASTGERGVLQVSGLHYTYDAAKDADKTPESRDRVTSVTLDDGSALDPQKIYTVAMPDFLATGGDAMQSVFAGVPADRVTINMDRPLRDIFASVLRTFPQPLTPKLDGRITVLNPPPSRPQ
jgi:5'-nucleotidase